MPVQKINLNRPANESFSIVENIGCTEAAQLLEKMGQVQLGTYELMKLKNHLLNSHTCSATDNTEAMLAQIDQMMLRL
ncbi:MAG: hypothetical protein WCW17_00600 [Patescibacteria group bacterium]